MSRIKYNIGIERVAVIRNPKNGQMAKVGTVEAYKHEGDTVYIEVRLDDGMPNELKESIEKFPQALTIVETPTKPRDVIIIPTLSEIKP